MILGIAQARELVERITLRLADELGVDIAAERARNIAQALAVVDVERQTFEAVRGMLRVRAGDIDYGRLEELAAWCVREYVAVRYRFRYSHWLEVYGVPIRLILTVVADDPIVVVGHWDSQADFVAELDSVLARGAAE